MDFQCITNNKMWRGMKCGATLGAELGAGMGELLNSPFIIPRGLLNGKLTYGAHTLTRFTTSFILGVAGGVAGGVLGGSFGAFGTALNQANKAALWVSDFTLPEKTRNSHREARNNADTALNKIRTSKSSSPNTQGLFQKFISNRRVKDNFSTLKNLFGIKGTDLKQSGENVNIDINEEEKIKIAKGIFIMPK